MALESFLAELADPALPLKSSSLVELSGLTSDEVRSFRERWPAVPEERRIELVKRLEEISEDNVELDFVPVFFVAINDPNPEVRFEAVQGLWEYDGRDLIAPLISRLREDEEPGVRAAAALALGRFAVLAEYDRLRSSDIVQVDEALLHAAQDPAEMVEVRARAIEAVGARSEPWVRDLIDEAYTSGNPRLRVSAIHAMGRNCDVEWLPSLIDNLSDDDAEVRYEAALACGAIGEDEAAPYLADMIGDEDTEVRLAAIEALGAIGSLGGSETARETLEAHANDEDEAVREAARAALEEVIVLDDPFGFLGKTDRREARNGHE